MTNAQTAEDQSLIKNLRTFDAFFTVYIERTGMGEDKKNLSALNCWARKKDIIEIAIDTKEVDSGFALNHPVFHRYWEVLKNFGYDVHMSKGTNTLDPAPFIPGAVVTWAVEKW